VGLNFDFHEFGTQSDYFITDPKFIELIIMNLFDNAVKFTGKNGAIQVQVSRRDGALTVMVRDNGKGMDQADYTRIFDRFNRLERNINSLESGHGLGLSIVKLLVEMLQGDLHMDSQPGTGTTFTCIIPEMISETQVESVSTEGNEFLFLNEEVF
jgi:signal transduction histidine kinase